MGEISDLPIFVDASAGATLGEIRARARRLHHQHGLDLLMVDYLQLLALDGKSENRVQEVSAISRGLKALAGELNVPLLALSQLSRAVESRSSRVPLLSDLRDSGALEQDADVVLFLYREELYDPASAKKGTVEVHIAKHRNGPTGVVPLGFDAATTGFRSLERYRTPEGW
jgi:replicative DNA helicase